MDKKLNEKIVSLRRENNELSTEMTSLLTQTVESLAHSIALVGVIDEAVNCITQGNCDKCTINDEMNNAVCHKGGSCSMNVKTYLLNKADKNTKKKIEESK